MADTDSKHRGADENGPQRRSRWWVAVLTFVLGVAAGVLAVGLLDTSTPEFQSASGNAPPATPSPSGIQSVPVAASAQVNAACLRVINEAQDVAIVLGEVGPAITAVDLQQLDDIVRRLQSIHPRLERDLSDCRVDTAVAGTPSPGPSVSPTPSTSAPSPTASPTR